MKFVTIYIHTQELLLEQTYLQTLLCFGGQTKEFKGIYSGSPLRAGLGGVWLALHYLNRKRQYQCVIEIDASPCCQTILSDFLYHEAGDHQDIYPHLHPLLKKHSILLARPERPASFLKSMVEDVVQRVPALRSRALRAAQLVAMGAIFRHVWGGYTCWSRSNPQFPYRIYRNKSGLWDCTCPDDSRPYLTDDQSVCKHLLAAMMNARLINETMPFCYQVA